MKTRWNGLSVLSTLLLATPAFAVDTAQTYRSGILVVGFLAFCALILVVQLLPALMMLFGWIKGAFRKTEHPAEKAEVKVH